MNTDISNFLASFPYAASTRRTYEDVLSRIFAGSQDPAKMTASDLLEILGSSGWGNKRQCLALAAVQKFLRWKFGDSHSGLSARIKRIRGKVQPALKPDEALKLLASFDPYTAKGARDLALCLLALDTGLRASELCRLEAQYVSLERGVLQVIVKGGQWATAIFCAATAAHIDRWLQYRITAEPALFVNIGTRQPLTPEGLNQIVR